MGIFNRRFNHISLNTPTPTPNPNPKNYKIIKSEIIGEYIIIMVNYPDCTNFEGNKILVYKNNITELLNQKEIDPHFSTDTISPIARFKPTDEGWSNAVNFIKYI